MTSPTRRSVRAVSLATTVWPTPQPTCQHLVQQVKKKIEEVTYAFAFDIRIRFLE